jgi:hypothetical protein
MWRRTKDGHDIESDFAFPISERSLILWYNGQDGEGNHYDALLVVDEGKFRVRASNCSRLNNLLKKEDPNSSQLSLDWIGGVPMDDDGPAPDGSNSRAEATRPPQVNEVITSTPTTLTRGGNSSNFLPDDSFEGDGGKEGAIVVQSVSVIPDKTERKSPAFKYLMEPIPSGHPQRQEIGKCIPRALATPEETAAIRLHNSMQAPT